MNPPQHHATLDICSSHTLLSFPYLFRFFYTKFVITIIVSSSIHTLSGIQFYCQEKTASSHSNPPPRPLRPLHSSIQFKLHQSNDLRVAASLPDSQTTGRTRLSTRTRISPTSSGTTAGEAFLIVGRRRPNHIDRGGQGLARGLSYIGHDNCSNSASDNL